MLRVESDLQVINNRTSGGRVKVNHALLIANVTGEEQKLCIEGVELSGARYYALDNERLLSWSPATTSIPNNTVILIEW